MKIKLLLLFSLGITSISFGGYFDSWKDESLCGRMEKPTPIAGVVAEVEKRGLDCSTNANQPWGKKPGFKIKEGTNMWVKDDESPLWEIWKDYWKNKNTAKNESESSKNTAKNESESSAPPAQGAPAGGGAMGGSMGGSGPVGVGAQMAPPPAPPPSAPPPPQEAPPGGDTPSSDAPPAQAAPPPG